MTNCPIGVFAAYVSAKGHAFMHRVLYLPKAWTSDLARMRTAHVPETRAFATKPKWAAGRATRAITAGVPFSWVAADSIYGVGELETSLRRAGKGYVLGVTAKHWFNSWQSEIHVAGEAQEIAQTLPADGWKCLFEGGPRR